ncbi:hypothetical protein ALI22I_04270 [Saccharothrix sp. ALI-22-I]|uniref:hypothetical protein n=1 Tax=Saccharothrix sp. ALI-22-I TaxID=1933778 RepID=UPI00097C6D0F|nr:hypothetical protein [Saccharothrix sp. ALI-22-I]ONI92361.1 hypothetical protein ALI22I_04270 [Saccharothrix sp. ALI-22-I]
MTRFLRPHPPLMLFSLLMGITALVSLGGLIFDDRILVGSPIWFKPFKFAVSLGLYGVTLAWMLTLTTRFRRTTRWAGTVVALTGTIEMAVIVGQVVRGTRSHFNIATPFDKLLWDIMTYSILTLWIMHAAIAVALLFTRFNDRTAGLAIRLGLFLALIGLALGILMTGQRTDDDVAAGIVGAHSVGVPDGGPQMALTGWSTTGGDLRIPHFVGIHALQVVPLAVMLFRRRATTKLVWGVTIGYAGLMALVTWQALRGQPLLRPDLLTALGALAVATWTAAVVARTLNKTETTEAVPA